VGHRLAAEGSSIIVRLLPCFCSASKRSSIRMAVGGRGRDILFQFLTEAVVLATVGGVIG
jgi:putative ABC transport system permease protein